MVNAPSAKAGENPHASAFELPAATTTMTPALVVAMAVAVYNLSLSLFSEALG